MFGKNVARLVDGVTKLSKIEAQSENERAAENLRKFLLAMSSDIRVLLVKLADRLHNMRTLHFIKDAEKRRRIARETMDIYAPLAERIGMYEFMTEMQTLAFRELEPDAYESIIEAARATPPERRRRSHSADRPRHPGASRGERDRGRGPGPRKASLFDLAQDGRAPCQLRADHRHHGLPRHRPDGRGLLPHARRDPPALADGAGPLQGLHLDAQAQRLSLAAHRDHP